MPPLQWLNSTVVHNYEVRGQLHIHKYLTEGSYPENHYSAYNQPSIVILRAIRPFGVNRSEQIKPY